MRIGTLTSNNTTTPFFVTKKSLPNGRYTGNVNINSDLLTSTNPKQFLSITGLGVDFPLIANDIIWLKVTTKSLNATISPVSAEINSYGKGNSDYTPGQEIQSNSLGQTAAYLLIAYTTPDKNGKPFLIQSCFSHLRLDLICFGGVPALYFTCSPVRRYGVTSS